MSPSAGRDVAIDLRVSRNMSTAIVLSVLLHILVLIGMKEKLLQPNESSAEAPPIVMQLNLAAAPKPAPPVPTPPVETPKEIKPKPIPPPRAPKKPATFEVLSSKNPSPLSLPIETPAVQKPAPQSPPPTPAPNAPTDMMSYVAAQRARRQQNEEYASRENAAAAARERKPSEDEARNEIIKRNLQPGTNGLFQLVNLGPHSAQFTFKGWTTDYSNARREFFQVEAGPDEDIQRNVARKMIEIIRRHYSGDFDFDSRRLNRVVSLSARKEDTAGLEDFLIAEFFGSGR